MLLLLDNYDSFTYNLYQYLAELGAEVIVRRNDQVSLDEIEQMQPDHIVVSPGVWRTRHPCARAGAWQNISYVSRWARRFSWTSTAL